MARNGIAVNNRLRDEFYEQRFFPDEKIVRIEEIRADRIRIDLDDGKQYDYDSRLKFLCLFMLVTARVIMTPSSKSSC